MKLISYEAAGAQRYGVDLGDKYVDLGAALAAAGLSPVPSDMVQFLETGDWGMDKLPSLVELARGNDKLVHAAAESRLLAPIIRPPLALGIGRNYSDHAAEVKATVPGLPKMSIKIPSTVIGPGASVIHPHEAKYLDYEAELAIVIGKTAAYVSCDEALDYVAGYSIINDMGMKDIQSKDSQTILGKNFRTFTPLGPCIVTKDELPDPQSIRIRLWVNGDLRQDGNTRDMIYDVRTIVSFLSSVMDLEPGTIIHTGSPAGVGWAMNPPQFLRPGDVVKVEMSGIGVLENDIVASPIDPAKLHGPGVAWPGLVHDLAAPVPGNATR